MQFVLDSCLIDGEVGGSVCLSRSIVSIHCMKKGLDLKMFLIRSSHSKHSNVLSWHSECATALFFTLLYAFCVLIKTRFDHRLYGFSLSQE